MSKLSNSNQAVLDGSANDQLLLQLDDLHMQFPLAHNWRGQVTSVAHALNGVRFDIYRSETLGIVGESGCGKSTLAQVLMGLYNPTQGQLHWPDEHLTLQR